MGSCDANDFLLQQVLSVSPELCSNSLSTAEASGESFSLARITSLIYRAESHCDIFWSVSVGWSLPPNDEQSDTASVLEGALPTKPVCNTARHRALSSIAVYSSDYARYRSGDSAEDSGSSASLVATSSPKSPSSRQLRHSSRASC